MQNKINEVNKDIDYTLKLIGKYPYLTNSLSLVIERLKNHKKELEEISSSKDLPDYKGESFNLIDKDNDTLSTMKAKLEAQQDWIDKNK